MGFHLFLFLVLIAAGFQIARMTTKSADRMGEVVLRWTLVGYCGVPMIGFMGYGIFRPDELAAMTGFEPGSPFQTFTMWALLGMGVAATLSWRLRGPYLVGPALSWAIFFVGATSIHLTQFSSAGSLTHGAMLQILATHGLISVILLGSLWASAPWRQPPPTTEA